MHLAQIAQYAEDLDRAEAFYSNLLEQPRLARFDPPGLLFFDLGGTRLLLENRAPSALLYLMVDDVRATLARLSGVTIVSQPHAIFRHEDATLGRAGTEEWHAFILDSEGNTIGLIEQTSDTNLVA